MTTTDFDRHLPLHIAHSCGRISEIIEQRPPGLAWVSYSATNLQALMRATFRLSGTLTSDLAYKWTAVRLKMGRLNDALEDPETPYELLLDYAQDLAWCSGELATLTRAVMDELRPPVPLPERDAPEPFSY